MIRRKIGGKRISRYEPEISKRLGIDLEAIRSALLEFIDKELGDLIHLTKSDLPNGTVDICLPVFSYVLRETVRLYTGRGGATLVIMRTGERELSFVLELSEIPSPESFAAALIPSGESGLQLEFIENKIIMRTAFSPKTKLTIRSRDKRLLTSELLLTFFMDELLKNDV